MAPERAPTAPKSSATVPAVDVSGVRVSAERLDALIACGGDLLLAPRRLAHGRSTLPALQGDLRRLRADWHQVAPALLAFVRSTDELMRSTDAGPDGHDGALAPWRLAGFLEDGGQALEDMEARLERLATELEESQRALEQSVSALDEDMLALRTQPFEDACLGLGRVVRDLAHQEGRQVALRFEGTEQRLDRAVVEALRGPLRHLVRNAVTHGVESPEQRRAVGKPPEGRVTVSARVRGERVDVAVTDDGAGLDLDAIAAELTARGLPVPADRVALTRAVFIPGLTTAPAVTDLAGRGVGLDVVRGAVEELGGEVEIQSHPGRGATFSLLTPLTLSSLRALLVRAGEELYALDTAYVSTLQRVDREAIRSLDGRDVLFVGDDPVELTFLSTALALSGGRSPDAQASSAPRGPGGRGERADKLPVVIIAAGGRRSGLVVDAFEEVRTVRVKRMGRRLEGLGVISGATVLEEGRVVLIIHAAALIDAMAGSAPSSGGLSLTTPERPVRQTRVLLVEDSLTTRSLEQLVLEEAGYVVTTAVDGADAWRILQTPEGEVDLVVSDVEMPRMDGVQLTEAIRRSDRLSGLPVILVTGLAGEHVRARGLKAGASAYIVKGAFDQTVLLETMASFVS